MFCLSGHCNTLIGNCGENRKHFKLKSRKDGSAVKNNGYSSQILTGVESQDPHSGSPPPVTQSHAITLFWPPPVLYACGADIHASEKTHTYKIKAKGKMLKKKRTIFQVN